MSKPLKLNKLLSNRDSSSDGSPSCENRDEQILIDLLEKTVKPIVNSIVNLKIKNNFDAKEEVKNEITLQIISYLQSINFNQRAENIRDFESYVAVIAYHACNRFISQQSPNRRRLKDAVRYLLAKRPEFALWQTIKTKWLGGFSEWKGQEAGLINLELRGDAKLFSKSFAPNSPQPRSTIVLLDDLFTWSKSPVELEVIVNAIADVQGVSDQKIELDDESSGLTQTLCDSRLNVESELTNRLYLQKLWKEIRELPAFQRKALLLSLRDESGESTLDLFILTKTATFDEIAAVLELSIDQFAELWNTLPIEDLEIGRMLNLSRQQIINLRKAARERLGRRMKSF